MKKIGIAILGLGAVGGSTYKLLQENRAFYAETQRLDIGVESVLEPDGSKLAALGVPQELVASNIAEVACNPDVNALVECIDSVDLAKEYVLAALFAGKTVITSNKELYCKYSHELERTAKEHNAGLYFEASCVGGLPIIRMLLDGVQSNKIGSMLGIVNGTSNFILEKMEEGLTYGEALAEAQKRGCADADPAADVDGSDAAYKLSVLSSLAFHTKVPFTNVYREGIKEIAPEDVAYGSELGYTLKLLAVGKHTEEGIEVRVHPTFLKKDHPLAAVGGCYNAVHLTGDAVGDVMLYGKGTGALPTGSAIVSDIIFAATHGEHKYSPYKNTENADKSTRFVTDFRSGYYVRMRVPDRAGVLSKVASVFGKSGISLSGVLRRPDDMETLVVMTHETRESAVKEAIAKLEGTGVAKVETVLRTVS